MAEFLDVIGTRSLKSFPPCYSDTSTNGFYSSPSPPPFSKSGLKLVCDLNIVYGRKPQVWELSRLCPEASTKLYVHEFGFRFHKLLIFGECIYRDSLICFRVNRISEQYRIYLFLLIFSIFVILYIYCDVTLTVVRPVIWMTPLVYTTSLIVQRIFHLALMVPCRENIRT